MENVNLLVKRLGRRNHGFFFLAAIYLLTRYAIEKIGFYETKKKSGLGITFDNVVEQTISELQVGTKTLLVRFGGIIGVGKNLLWIIIFSVSSFIGLWSFLNSRIRFNTKIGRK